ncbi:MAG: rhomboid family intramembrane serine protease [Dokdonella sp.]|jgi:membrane associated rhomboid family serine protease|uniref:rhomboid family intramembrane serine protease n=1 Tax=Dokdonella sp. TaxID=2291710 RepID=UPI002C6178A6|nr:rhomboid family intramembrane serine protease [Dokdonella sp.]MCC6440047.1 rhomboid family intramembrane serine protease [Rhodanobacteraceae bacterium]HNV09558.1 rhomboid family intramembrane serine protease [Dokdonella sp.]
MPIDLPPVTRALLISNVGIFLLQQLFPDALLIHFALWPLGSELLPDGTTLGFQIWQLLSYGFLHGGLTHLFFNMLALWMFGGAIERLFGSRPFAIYYISCVIGAAIAQLIVIEFFSGGFYPTLGASGGVFGLLLAFGMMFPHQRIMLLFPPIPMPAWVFVTGYGVIELYLGVTGSQAGVAHFAHLGGMVAGFAIIQYWRGRLPIKPRRILMR